MSFLIKKTLFIQMIITFKTSLCTFTWGAMTEQCCSFKKPQKTF